MSNLSSMFGMYNVAIPDEGPKCIRADLDFSSLNSINIEGLLATTTGTMSYIQGVFIDNRTNDNPVTLSCSVTGQVISCPANSQGYFPVLITNPPRFVATTTPVADLRVLMFFYNVPIQPIIWGENGVVVSIPGTVTVTQPIGGAYTDRSIANLSGVSETLMAANANRHVLVVSNEGATAIALNLTGGAAALNTAGSITLAAGGSLVLDNYPPTGIINIIGTANADVTAYEG